MESSQHSWHTFLRRKLLATISFVVIIALFACLYSVYPEIRTAREFDIRTVESSGFCGTDEIYRKDGTYLGSIKLCESNIESIRELGDWLTITTDVGGGWFKINTKTGETLIVNQ